MDSSWNVGQSWSFLCKILKPSRSSTTVSKALMCPNRQIPCSAAYQRETPTPCNAYYHMCSPTSNTTHWNPSCAHCAQLGATYIATGDKRIYICGTSNARNPNESRSRDFYCPNKGMLAWPGALVKERPSVERDFGYL